MKQLQRIVAVFAAIALFLAVSPAYAEYALSLGEFQDNEAPLRITSEEDVEGFVAAVQFDGSKLDVTAIDGENKLKEELLAELVVTEIYEDGFTLGVVMDYEEPFEGQVIPAGENTEVAMIGVRGGPEEVPLNFVDGVFGDPALDNLLVVGGRSIASAEGLELKGVTYPGEVRVQKLIAETVELPAGETSGTVEVSADNTRPLQGFVLSVAHGRGEDVVLDSIDLKGTAAEAAGAEFVQDHVYPGQGGTVGVVLDFEAPYEGQAIPVGDSPAHIANFNYSYVGPKLEPDECITAPVRFEDDVFGDPLLQNILVEGGESIFPKEFVDGAITFCGGIVPDIHFYVNLEEATVSPGMCTDIGYYYSSAKDPIQGVSIASCYDERLAVGDIDLTGTITAGINAEFVEHHASEGELIIGILVDSTPPVSVSQMFPSSDTPRLLCKIEFCASEDLTCGECLDLTFCDGITGAGTVPIDNRASVFNESVPVRVHNGETCVTAEPYFKRGDCNYDSTVDIADPASILSYVFLGVYDPPCLDACDGNDDGVVDLADSVKVLRYLFKFDSAPPAPGPDQEGPDPTPDIYGRDLGCIAGDQCP